MRVGLCFLFLLVTSISLAAPVETVCTFKGNVDFLSRNIQLEINFSGKEKILSSFTWGNDAAFLNSRIEHLRINQADFSTELESSFFIENPPGNKQNIKGLIWTRYSLLNHKPFREVAGSFKIKEGRLFIEDLTWSEMRFSGQVNLNAPFDLDVSVDIADMDINELAPFAGKKPGEVYLSGLISGKIKLFGYLKRLQVKGQLRSQEGEVQDFIYRDAGINFSGYYPVVDIEDSAISDERGYIYNLAGRFNAGQINNFTSQEHQIKVSPFSQQDLKSQNLMIRRKEELGSDSELEIGYRLKPRQPYEALYGEREGILGIERKHKF
ncbi:MAG: hypothetical protein Q8N14_00305 [Candidatus Omnitrophota bacterium]|nr:hypothetical protein [Candidatus Omnitrophota bacterium]